MRKYFRTYFSDVHKLSSDFRAEKAMPLLEIISELDSRKIDFNTSFIDLEDYNTASDCCRLSLISATGDLSFRMIKACFTGYITVDFGFGEDIWIEETNPDDIPELVREFLSLKFEAESWGINGKVYRVKYQGYKDLENKSSRDFFVYFLKKKSFWDPPLVLLDTQKYESYLDSNSPSSA
ncbi:MAG: hypothetical protein U0T73_08590 [Chitinophagales bacterium]